MISTTRPNDRRIAICLLCFSLVASPTAFAETKSDSERLEKLERAVELLQKRNAELEQEVKSLKKEKPSAPAPLSTEKRSRFVPDSKSAVVEKTETVEEKKPVYVVPGAAEYKLTLGGYIQANFEAGDVSAFEGRFGLTALKDRFRLRRTRINLSGDYKEQFEFKVEGDFSQSDGLSPNTRTGFSATDIFINWHAIPEANLKVGQWKAPFGLEQITPDATIFTIERSLPTGALTPERQIGVMLWGKPLTNVLPEQKDLVTYYAGMFNGNGRNFNNNDNNEFMYVGRLELLPFKGKLMGQEASLKIAGDYLFSRDETGTNISPALNLKVNTDGSLTSFTLTSPDERHAYSFDAWLKIGPFDLIGEYFDEHVDGRAATGVKPIADFEAKRAITCKPVIFSCRRNCRRS